MNNTRHLLPLVLTSAVLTTAAAKAPDPCSASCAIALQALITAGYQPVVAGSSCDGNYGQSGPATIAMVLTREFASFGRGKNVIEGACSTDGAGVCKLNIHHSYGEDVSSLDIEFKLKDGKIAPESLRCALTP